MTRVLVVNHAHSVVCGIHDLGVRVFHCLEHSSKLEVGYAEAIERYDYYKACEHFGPDAIIVNHRDDLTPWAGKWGLHPVIAVLHQYEESTADARAAALHPRFDWIIALDPLLQPSYDRLVAVGRPIPETVPHSDRDFEAHPAEPWRIGSFGFAFPHKGFGDVASEIAMLGEPAVYRLHAPEAFFNGAGGAPLYIDGIIADVLARLSEHPFVHLDVSTDHRPERELVAMLAANDVNALLYVPGQPDAGLSSALDYLIAARRPMLLSEASMFRHAWMEPNARERGPSGERILEKCAAADWARIHLSQVIERYPLWQQLADELYDFHHGRLVADIEALLERIL